MSAQTTKRINLNIICISILGLVSKQKSGITENYSKIIKELFLLSDSRGKEASGFASIQNDSVFVHKTPFSATKMVESKLFKSYFQSFTDNRQDTYTTIGHSRLVTDGYEHDNINNQPVYKNNTHVVHNGIIVNTSKIWENLHSEKKLSNLDTEIIPTLIGASLSNGNNLKTAVNDLFELIEGMTSIAMIFDSINCLLLATNNGSLHYSLNYNKDALIFASESQILKNVIKNNSLESYFNYESVDQLKADSTLLINLSSLDTDHKELYEPDEYNNIEIRDHSLNIVENHESIAKEKLYKNTSLNNETKRIPKSFIELYEARVELISNIKRCKICILPITHPYIEFDENGICNYCSNYKKNELKGKDSFAKIVNKYDDKKNKYSCLVPLVEEEIVVLLSITLKLS